VKLTIGKLTKEQIQAALQIPVFRHTKDLGGDWELVSSKEAGGDWRVTSFSSSSPPMGRGYFFPGFLLSSPVIRWFAPKCRARISEGLNAQAREAWEGEAWGDLRCTKPRWHRGHHFWRNPN
jgi:hypothetical protein